MRGKNLAKFYLGVRVFYLRYCKYMLHVHRAYGSTKYLISQSVFQLPVQTDVKLQPAHIIEHLKENVLVSCHSAAPDSTATTHAGFPSYAFSSNLLSDFEPEAHFLPFELTTLSLGDFNFRFSECLSSASH